jgi:hypothetical protein
VYVPEIKNKPYEKENKLIIEIDIEVPSMELLKKILVPKKDDPELDDGYKIRLSIYPFSYYLAYFD